MTFECCISQSLFTKSIVFILSCFIHSCWPGFSLFKKTKKTNQCLLLPYSSFTTWFDTGLCFSPGLLRISSSCRLLKLDTPRDFTSPASLQASRACPMWKKEGFTLHFDQNGNFMCPKDHCQSSSLLTSSTCKQLELVNLFCN